MYSVRPRRLSAIHGWNNPAAVGPDVQSYEQQKGLRVAATQENSPRSSEPEALLSVFQRRLEALLADRLTDAPSIYPGSFIAKPGCSKTFVARGTFFREQFEYFRKLGWFANESVVITTRDVPSAEWWPWKTIDEPNVRFLFAERSVAQAVLPSAHCGEDPSSLLHSIHRLWDSEIVEYTPEALQTCSHWLSALRDLPDEKKLTAMFELEAFASYLTFTQNLTPISTGVFHGNWMSIFSLPVDQISQTELCVTSRILDELLNLCSVRFAPVNINEYFSVADGNHRLTSLWIWNLLQHCTHTRWDINLRQFQCEIATAVAATGLSNRHVTLRESLLHLGILLSDPATAECLERKLKPRIRRTGALSAIPVVMVPEYLSCAAAKHQYDTGTAINRAYPVAYRAMSGATDLVLPPRTAYHYTDRVLLPWFKVTG